MAGIEGTKERLEVRASGSNNWRERMNERKADVEEKTAGEGR